MKCCDLTAGKMRHTVDLQHEIKTDDGGGGVGLAWTRYATVVGFLKPLAGNEALNAARIESKVSHRFWTRYRPGILTKHRLVYNGRPMQIRAVINLEERNKWLELDLEEGVVT
jgi:SPP1 family predicted phage head-tail adaptor